MQEYLFRTTTNKLVAHRTEILEAGDTIVSQDFQGGRDWVLTCRKSGDDEPDEGPFNGTIERTVMLGAMEQLLGRSASDLREVRVSRDSVEVVEFAVDNGGRRRIGANGAPVLLTTRYGVTG